jgi:succinate dehydrogenase / fumarate reductase cytochrome b subunit
VTTVPIAVNEGGAMSWVSAFLGSSVGRKLVMAVTGIVLFGFVVGHLLGNLQIYQGPEKINHYAHLLKSMGPLLWAVRAGLLLIVGLHIWAATVLTLTSWSARPIGYRKTRYQESDYASRTMRWSGPLLFLFIVYHLLHFTTGTVHPHFDPADVYSNVVIGFSNPWVAGFYILAMLALGLHLYHGLWSMLQSLGLSHPRYDALRRVFAAVFTLFLVGGNISIPVAVLTGVIR